MMNLLIYIFIITILFLIYVEYSVGNIIYRQNSLGDTSFQISNIISYLCDPLYNSFLWNIELLDVNYIFILSMSLFLYIIYYILWTMLIFP